MARGIYKRGPHQFQVKIRRNGVSLSETFEDLRARKRGTPFKPARS
jgi:hypothetical protein